MQNGEGTGIGGSLRPLKHILNHTTFLEMRLYPVSTSTLSITLFAAKHHGLVETMLQSKLSSLPTPNYGNSQVS